MIVGINLLPLGSCHPGDSKKEIDNSCACMPRTCFFAAYFPVVPQSRITCHEFEYRFQEFCFVGFNFVTQILRNDLLKLCDRARLMI